jgi:mannosyltransferase OCH1-like enzyme
LRDASVFLGRSRVFTYKEHDTYAGFANFFRYRMLLEKGGWWVDMDTVCLAPFDFDEPYVFSSEGLNVNRHVNVGAVKAPAGSEIMRIAWEACEQMDPRALRWSQCGPTLFGRIVEQCALQRYVSEPEVFCPIHFSEWRKVLDPAAVWWFGPNTRAVHLWNELWRREAQDKNREYREACLYETLKRRYGCVSNSRAKDIPNNTSYYRT